MRFKQRKNVDLPHPDGPMSAVMARVLKSSETFSIAMRPAYLAVTSCATSSDVISRSSSACPNAMMPGRVLMGTRTQRYARKDVQHENHYDQDEGAGPGLAVPVFVGRDRVGKYLQRELRHWAARIDLPKLTA